MLRLIRWVLRWLDAIREAKQPHVKIKPEWIYDKNGDTRRDR